MKKREFMKYEDFLDQLSKRTSTDVVKLREILLCIPDVLMKLKENEYVRTPLGVFRLRRRNKKRVKIPNTKKWAFVEEQLYVHFKAGKKCKVRAVPKKSDF
jgi:nucleoid DNA-binding protein